MYLWPITYDGLITCITHMVGISYHCIDISHTAKSTECPGKNFPYIQMLDALRDGEPFFDIGEDYPYIKEVKTLKQLGIIKGNGKGYLKPHEFITREEAMLVAYRIMRLLQN